MARTCFITTIYSILSPGGESASSTTETLFRSSKGGLSHHQIAQLCGVSFGTVGDIRKSLPAMFPKPRTGHPNIVLPPSMTTIQGIMDSQVYISFLNRICCQPWKHSGFLVIQTIWSFSKMVTLSIGCAPPESGSSARALRHFNGLHITRIQPHWAPLPIPEAVLRTTYNTAKGFARIQRQGGAGMGQKSGDWVPETHTEYALRIGSCH